MTLSVRGSFAQTAVGNASEGNLAVRMRDLIITLRLFFFKKYISDRLCCTICSCSTRGCFTFYLIVWVNAVSWCTGTIGGAFELGTRRTEGA